jgi:anti-sigma B factor antagonist
MTLELKATPEEVMRAVEALQEFAQAKNIPCKTVFDLALALEESASNIVNHALQRDAQRRFQAAFHHFDDAFVIELRDPGPEFDPTSVADRELRAADEDCPGGWGIPLVRRFLDEIHYRRDAGENVLRLIKRLGGPDGSKPISTANQTHKTKIDMSLGIQIQKNIGGQDVGCIVVNLTGSLDTSTAPELERQLAPVLAPQGGIKDLVFDLAQLKFISSAGLRVFSVTRKILKERGGQASFIHLQPQIQEVFEIMKSLPGVAVFKDVEEMDRYLAARQHAHTEG